MLSPHEAEVVRRMLVNTRVEKLFRHQQDLLIMRETASVGDLLRCLAQRKLISAPVVTVINGIVHANECTHDARHPPADTLCFVDINDILLSFIRGRTRGRYWEDS